MPTEITNPVAGAVAQALCTESSPPAAPAAVPAPHRVRLWEVDQLLLCPVIGTCLTINDLLQALRKSGTRWERKPSDFEIHHLVVHRMDKPSRLGRILTKTLDKRYDRQVRALGQDRCQHALGRAWERAVDAGEIPGALWALVSNPASGDALRQRLYQDVHMLSHLNGNSHRRQLGRLHALEQEAGEVSEKLHSNGLRFRSKLRQRDRRIQELQQEVAALRAVTAQSPDCQVLESELAEARCELNRRELRADRAEACLSERQQRLDELSLDISALRELLQETREELALSERRWLELLKDRANGRRPSLLQGRRVAYVGGRPNLAPHLRAMVENLDGRFVHHDGGIEANRAAIEEVLAGADLVFCPVDCVSHDACSRAKSCCRRNGSTFVALRTASISAFSAALERAVGSPRSW